MANDFSTDSRCKALWRFENNLDDGKGGNHLTGSGSVAYSSADKREGSYSADFEQAESDYAYRSDANLDPGFPLKSGDVVKKISVCCWIKPESYQYPGYIFAKFDTSGNRRSFALVRDGGTIKVYNGYNAGASVETLDTGYSAYNGEWYHVGVSFDALNKTCLVRIFRASNSTTATYQFSLANETNVEDADVTVGARHGGGNYYDGLLDELVVFNELLSELEIDAIRSGTYNGPMPQVRSEAVGSLAAYEGQAAGRADALGVMAAYSLTPEATYVQGDAMGLLAAYHVAPPPKRVFPVPNLRVRWQSHPNLRKFPVVS